MVVTDEKTDKFNEARTNTQTNTQHALSKYN